jgi:protein associated with RNAse G/E
MKYTSRTTYWLNKPFNLGELYERTGHLKQIYIHIASPATIFPSALEYTDYELDVVKRQGEAPFVRDEDEFMEARLRYGYSEELCEVCRDAVVRAIELASRWRPSGPPRFGRFVQDG